jgi:hypothetical protein
MLTLGVVLIPLRMEIIGLVTVFTFGAMNASIASGAAVNIQSSILKDVTDNATWRDIGTAFGTLVGALLLSMVNIYVVFIASSILLISGLINHQFKLYKRIL